MSGGLRYTRMNDLWQHNRDGGGGDDEGDDGREGDACAAFQSVVVEVEEVS